MTGTGFGPHSLALAGGTFAVALVLGTPSSAAVATATRTPVETCATSSLSIVLGEGNGAVGHFYRPIVLTNISNNPCGITGYPGVSYVAGGDRHQIGDAASREAGPKPEVVLQQGQSALGWLNQVNVDNYDFTACEPTPVDGLRVYPPDNTESVILPVPHARGCTRHMSGQSQLTVAPMRSAYP